MRQQGKNEGVHLGQCGCSFEGKAWAAGKVKATGTGRGLNPEGLVVLLKTMVLNWGAGGKDGQENFNFYFF